jgi:hypothetical protein
MAVVFLTLFFVAKDEPQAAPSAPPITTGPLAGESPERVKFVKTNFADDWARCRAFWTISANGDPGQTTPVLHPPKATEADQMMLMLVGVETPAAKSSLAMDSLSKEMDYDYTNFSRLIVRHGEFCAQLRHDPTPRIHYWVAEAKRRIAK